MILSLSFQPAVFSLLLPYVFFCSASDSSTATHEPPNDIVLLNHSKKGEALVESFLHVDGTAAPLGQNFNAFGPTSNVSKPSDRTPLEANSKETIRPNIVEHSFPTAQVPLNHFTAIYAPLPNYTQYRSGPVIIPIILGNITVQQPVYQMLSTVVLVRDGENNTCNILVDTGLPIDRNILVAGLATHGVHLNQVHYVVLTHGHPDHIGNLNLFPASRTFFGRLGMRGHTFVEYRESVGRNGEGRLVNLCKHSRIYATAGHTSSDLSLVVSDVQGYGTVAVTGDLFASENDFGSGEIWQKFSSFPRHQERNRRMILCISDVIFPGHGHPFRASGNWLTSGDGSQMSVSFSVLSFTDGHFALRMDRSEIVLQIKRQIEVVAGLPSEVQRLVYRNRELGDRESIDSAGIVDGAIIHLVIKSRSAFGVPRKVSLMLRNCKHLVGDVDKSQKGEVLRDTDSLATSDECEPLDLTFTKEREADAHRRATENLQTMERMRSLRADMERIRFQKQQRRPQVIFRCEALAEGHSQVSGDEQPSSSNFMFSACNTEDTSAKESSAGETELEEFLPHQQSCEEPLKTAAKSFSDHNDNAAAGSPSSDLLSSCSDAEQESSVVCSSELDPSIISEQEDLYVMPDELNTSGGFYRGHCNHSDEGPSREPSQCKNDFFLTECSRPKGRTRHLSTTAATEDLASDPSELSSGMVISNAYRKYRAKRRPHLTKGAPKRSIACPTNNGSLPSSSMGSSKNCTTDQGRLAPWSDVIQRRGHMPSKLPTSDVRLFQRQVSKTKQRPSASRVESSTCESSSDERDLFASDRIMQAVESIFEKKCCLTTRKANQDFSATVSIPPVSTHVVRTRKPPQSSQSQQRCKVCGCKLTLSMAFRCRCGKTLCTRHKAPKFHPCFETRNTLEVRSLQADKAGPSSDSDRVPGPIT